MAEDRLAVLRDATRNTTLVGVDYVWVDPTTQALLRVYFVGSAPAIAGVQGTAFLGAGQVSITTTAPDSSTVPTVVVISTAWGADPDGRPFLGVTTPGPGDFTRYTLTVSDPGGRVDPFYKRATFRFQAGCPSDLDCREADEACTPEEEPDVTIDYTARDFWSVRQALLDFAAQRYPQWTDRLEADVGMMLVEAMSAVADEMAYYQDRVAREAHLETATQRRSLRGHARLLDYEVHDGLAGHTWLVVTVDDATVTGVLAGEAVWAESDSGARVVFEVGSGLADVLDGKGYPLSDELNALAAHVWDEDETCLRAGSTSLHVVNDGVTTPLLAVGRRVVLRTSPTDASIPTRAYTVVLTGVQASTDPLFGVDLLELTWSADEAPTHDLDLDTLTVYANVVPATAGRTVEDGDFVIRPEGAAWDPDAAHAIERVGPDHTTAFLRSLDDTGDEALCWLERDVDETSGEFVTFGDEPRRAAPEVYLAEIDGSGTETPWTWRRSLLGSPSSQATDRDFTLVDGLYQEVARYWRGEPSPIRHYDYKTGKGFTIRFGDDVIGASPARGTRFRLVYRVGGGTVGNVPAGTLTHTDAAGISFTNPFAVTTGVDPESVADIRKHAPQAWRAQTFRAVRAEDYAEALERLDWVGRAGARLRWTGSWLTLFATPDPRDRVTLAADQRTEAEAQLARFRQAGREAHVLDPVYAWIDLGVTVCVEPTAYRAQVKAAVLDALFGASGFFDPDNFTFGDPLVRSALEAAIQAVPGVRAVEDIQVRRRGFFDWKPFTDETLTVGDNEVIGTSNDARYPERGVVKLTMEGGA